MNKQDWKQWENGFILDMLKGMPESKKAQLKKIIDTNCYLTTYCGMNTQIVHVYKEGWYLEFSATRRTFKMWVRDNDGEFVYGERKPHENKLHRLYSSLISIEEHDFIALVA